MLQPEYLRSRSQDLEKTYHDAGQFYVCMVDDFKKTNSLWGANTAGIVLSELEVQDLDTLTDWQLAEMKFKLTKNNV
jgi:N-acylneuraminate cytidylyltransferase